MKCFNRWLVCSVALVMVGTLATEVSAAEVYSGGRTLGGGKNLGTWNGFSGSTGSGIRTPSWGGSNSGGFNVDLFGGGRNNLFNGGNNNFWNGGRQNSPWPSNNFQNNYPPRQQFIQPQQPRYVQPQPQYVQPQPNPVPVQRYVQPATTVRANVAPQERLQATRPNVKPASFALDKIDAVSQQLVSEMVEQQATKAVDRMEEEIGDVADEPAVAAKIKDIRDKIALGMKVNDEDIKELENLIKQADPTKLPADFKVDDLHNNFDDIVAMSDANELMKQQIVLQGGVGGGWPTGAILTVPVLPDDAMLLLPDGAIVMGTGGEGSLGISTANAREVLDLNLGMGEPVPDSEVDVLKRPKSGTYISNPKSNQAAINYVVSNNHFSIKPGYKQTLRAGKTWIIRFDQGQGRGEAKYKLSEGTYEFTANADGSWGLYKQTYRVTIDNGANDHPFFVNVDNSTAEVAAGSSRTFTSGYPIFVQFDRGDRGEPALKKISENGAHLMVAVNPDDGLWDLYPELNFDRVARTEEKASDSNEKVRQALMHARLREALKSQE